MNQNLTEIIFILDRSGSMDHLTEETIGGFNSLIKKQKQEGGKTFVTTVLFDDEYEILYNHEPIQNVKVLTTNEYYARGCTALLDAIGFTIERVRDRLEKTEKDNRPGKVIMMITTDGYENASQKYSKSQIKEMIELQTKVYKWQFIFLGANIDAVGEADSLGIRSCMARNFTASNVGIKSTFNVLEKLINVMKLCDEYDDEFYDECDDIMSEVE